MARLSTLLFALALALPSAVRAEPPTPLLWEVSDADNRVYLLGSFHVLRAEDYPLADSVEAAFADAERVVFELAPEESGSPAMVAAFQAAARRDDGRRLQDALPPALWTRLDAHLRERGKNAAGLQPFDTWFVSLVLALEEMGRLGMDANHGLDRHMTNRALAAGKATMGLETGAQQIALFEEMTPKQQIASLEDALSDTQDLGESIERLHALWRAGDVDGLAAETLDEMRRDYPELYARMNRDRNLAWLPVIRSLLDDSDADDALVVVGAMHLLGDDGLVELLRAAGYTVERR